MSYARFGWQGSDVYVFTSNQGIECCGCSLQQRELVVDPDRILGWYLKNVGPTVEHIFRSNQQMIDHLMVHRERGETVPESALERLRDPEDERENQAIWSEYDDGISG
jgi:hypothetical protein